MRRPDPEFLRLTLHPFFFKISSSPRFFYYFVVVVFCFACRCFCCAAFLLCVCRLCSGRAVISRRHESRRSPAKRAISTSATATNDDGDDDGWPTRCTPRFTRSYHRPSTHRHRVRPNWTTSLLALLAITEFYWPVT